VQPDFRLGCENRHVCGKGGGVVAVKTYSAMREGNKVLSPHFKVKEFACKDGTDKVLIESELIDTLEKVFKHFNCSKINIGNRPHYAEIPVV
jgi:hypothetical protein